MAQLKWGCRGVWGVWGMQGVFMVNRQWYAEKEGTPTWDYTYHFKLCVPPLYCVVYIWEVVNVWVGGKTVLFELK